MAAYGYQSREPTFEDYYHSVPRSGMEPKTTRQTVEEMYRRGPSDRSPPPAGKGYNRRYDDSDSSEDEMVVRRRQVRRTRARSASTDGDRSRGKRRSSVPAKEGRELVRYQSRSRQQRKEGADDSSDDEKTVYASDREDEIVAAGPKACGPHCGKDKAPPFSLPPSFRHPHPDEEYDSDTDLHERKKRRNKRMLYTGLAAVGTLATCNGIYQNQKAFRARRQALDTQNPDCASEARALKKKALMQDLMAVGVVGIGLNNVRLAWARQQALKKEDAEATRIWREHKSRRPVSSAGDEIYRGMR